MAHGERGDDLRWLLEPPASGHVHLHFAAGEGVALSAEAREALDRLIRALSETDVQGHVMGVMGGASGVPRQYSCKIAR
jgi:hypothetical protein